MGLGLEGTVAYSFLRHLYHQQEKLIYNFSLFFTSSIRNMQNGIEKFIVYCTVCDIDSNLHKTTLKQ